MKTYKVISPVFSGGKLHPEGAELVTDKPMKDLVELGALSEVKAKKVAEGGDKQPEAKKAPAKKAAAKKPAAKKDEKPAEGDSKKPDETPNTAEGETPADDGEQPKGDAGGAE